MEQKRKGVEQRLTQKPVQLFSFHTLSCSTGPHEVGVCAGSDSSCRWAAGRVNLELADSRLQGTHRQMIIHTHNCIWGHFGCASQSDTIWPNSFGKIVPRGSHPTRKPLNVSILRQDLNTRRFELRTKQSPPWVSAVVPTCSHFVSVFSILSITSSSFFPPTKKKHTQCDNSCDF